MISLALGRTPTFNAFQNVSPGPICVSFADVAELISNIVDDTEDEQLWVPHFWGEVLPPDMFDYPPQPSHITSNHRQMIKARPAEWC